MPRDSAATSLLFTASRARPHAEARRFAVSQSAAAAQPAIGQ